MGFEPTHLPEHLPHHTVPQVSADLTAVLGVAHRHQLEVQVWKDKKYIFRNFGDSSRKIFSRILNNMFFQKLTIRFRLLFWKNRKSIFEEIYFSPLRNRLIFIFGRMIDRI